MKIKLICIGKTSKSFLKEGEELYLKRISHYCNIEKIEISELKNTKKLSIKEIKQKEGKLILKHINKEDNIILLDESGKEFKSLDFSIYLNKKINLTRKNLSFIIGGSYGFSNEIYRRADEQVSLSKMTFSHQMIRLFFLEQIYRCYTIINGKPYHNE
ncbi:MAG: 23S rRNA (pseudouridine(1915)-N(3))-methyltransferase RlmH [Crocinitomicaceae bacterium]|nr:23S rRNA (pseudouridine(1915)-N(3))-methyltransferase RlmH [Crocinitomicaceae bacterium]|tara:strand:+ start:7713 stop:8186 length:474 start_codon:yes stop_codon:yes gene_type:complete